jgi:hypothetical protein
MPDDFDGPIITELRLVDLIRANRQESPSLEHPKFRDCFYLRHDDTCIFRYPLGNGEYASGAYLMGLCKHGDDFCLRLLRGQFYPAPGERKDYPCGCACINMDLSILEDFNTNDKNLISEVIESKMIEAVERLKDGR